MRSDGQVMGARRVMALLVGLGLIVALVGCGGGREDEVTERPDATSGVTPATAETTTTSAPTTAAPTTTGTDRPTTTPSPRRGPNVIQVWGVDSPDGRNVWVVVLEGQLQLTSGLTMLAGSSIPVIEGFLELPLGLTIEVGGPEPPDGATALRGGVELRGQFYPNGTVLVVGRGGELIEV